MRRHKRKYVNDNIILIGLHTDGKATVTSAQIKPGDLIVSSGIHHIQDGETVTPLSATSKNQYRRIVMTDISK